MENILTLDNPKLIRSLQDVWKNHKQQASLMYNEKGVELDKECKAYDQIKKKEFQKIEDLFVIL